MQDPSLELSDIQGDVLIGLQKDAENFVFFEIADVGSFKGLVKQHIIRQITSAQEANRRDFVARQRKRQGQRPLGSLTGLNLGLTKEGLTQLLGASRPRLDPSFETGANHRDTVEVLHDPPVSNWLKPFASGRIDGVFLITGPNSSVVTSSTKRTKPLSR